MPMSDKFGWQKVAAKDAARRAQTAIRTEKPKVKQPARLLREFEPPLSLEKPCRCGANEGKVASWSASGHIQHRLACCRCGKFHKFLPRKRFREDLEANGLSVPTSDLLLRAHYSHDDYMRDVAEAKQSLSGRHLTEKIADLRRKRSAHT